MGKLRAIFLLTCCILIAIGPLNVMQMIAWGNMLHDYSKDRDLVEAAEMTFSGDYPCEMCRKIAEAKMKEQQGNDPAPFPSEERNNFRLDLHFTQHRISPDFNWPNLAGFQSGESPLMSPAARYSRVPTPPPQLASC